MSARNSPFTKVVPIVATLFVAAGCGNDAKEGTNEAGAGAPSAAGSAAGGASGGSAGSRAGEGGSSGGERAGAGGGGSSTGGAPQLPLPRSAPTSASPSVLDQPPMFPSKPADHPCLDTGVFCNGQCITTIGQSMGNCSALALNLGRLGRLVLDGNDLFFTSEDTELLRVDATTGKAASLYRGLWSPSALAVDAENVYVFGLNAFRATRGDIRAIPRQGGDGTILVDQLEESSAQLAVHGSELYFTGGGFDDQLFVAPRAGGPGAPWRKEAIMDWAIVGDDLIFMDKGPVRRAPLANPGLVEELTSTAAQSLIVDGDYIYWQDRDDFERIPLAGGTIEALAQTDADLSRVGGGVALFVKTDGDVTTVSTMPVTGGGLTPLFTTEKSELRSLAIGGGAVYASVGRSALGAILRVALP